MGEGRGEERLKVAGEGSGEGRGKAGLGNVPYYSLFADTKS